ncbi:MAG: lysine--tRNA ligase [Candidatus Lokiarchaeota archaeon]|nr:lysine--tRNA ligase [Candidatus Harpocratesius repetitus]
MDQTNEVKSQTHFPDHWLESIIKEIGSRNPKEVNLATGKTPSGHIHMGIMRELLICEAIRRIYSEKGFPVKFRLFIDSLDAAKRFPSYISSDYAKKHLGKPFALIPNPFNPKDTQSYAEFFGNELQDTFKEMGINAEIIWTHNLYKTTEMKEKIRIGLKKNELVKEIVARYLTKSMSPEQKQDYIKQQKTWMGAMVICEKCQSTQKKQKDGTISPNRVLEYIEQTDECIYKCPSCGYNGRVTIESGLVKLNWRLDWPAKWTIFNTICEPAGKDHCTPGGSYDTGLELCQKVYGYQGPIKVAYEWLRLGDRDMKTSKGIVFTPSKFLEMAEAKILRMLIYQTNPNKHISIRIEEMEQYYNEFQRIERIYYGLEEPTSESEKREIEYIYPLIIPNEIPKTLKYQIPFRFITILAQLKPILKEQGIINRTRKYLLKEYGIEDFNIDSLNIQLKKASNWIQEMNALIENEKNPQIKKELSQKIIRFSIIEEITPEIISRLNSDQFMILKTFFSKIQEEKELTEEKIKDIMINIKEELNVKPMKIFQAFYLIFLGNKKGPRLGPLMAMMDINWIKNRIQSVLSEK